MTGQSRRAVVQGCLMPLLKWERNASSEQRQARSGKMTGRESGERSPSCHECCAQSPGIKVESITVMPLSATSAISSPVTSLRATRHRRLGCPRDQHAGVPVNGPAAPPVPAELEALMDLRPINAGHLLVVPRAHAALLADLSRHVGSRVRGSRRFCDHQRLAGPQGRVGGPHGNAREQPQHRACRRHS